VLIVSTLVAVRVRRRVNLGAEDSDRVQSDPIFGLFLQERHQKSESQAGRSPHFFSLEKIEKQHHHTAMAFLLLLLLLLLSIVSSSH
jgi:hypothetical protein